MAQFAGGSVSEAACYEASFHWTGSSPETSIDRTIASILSSSDQWVPCWEFIPGTRNPSWESDHTRVIYICQGDSFYQ